MFFYHSEEVHHAFVENIQIATEFKVQFSLYMSWMQIGDRRYSCSYSSC
jgi:hypothetical protein